jgi:hypothetical protein
MFVIGPALHLPSYLFATNSINDHAPDCTRLSPRNTRPSNIVPVKIKGPLLSDQTLTGSTDISTDRRVRLPITLPEGKDKTRTGFNTTEKKDFFQVRTL